MATGMVPGVDSWPRCAAVTRRGPGLVAALLGLLLAACSGAPDADYRPEFSAAPATPTATGYVLAVHPLHNPKHLFEIYQPLVDRLNSRIPGLDMSLEASTDYSAFEAKLAHRQVAFALPNPYQTIKSFDHGYHVFAKMGDDAQFRGVVLVRRGSNIHVPADLVGKAVSFPAPTALAATLLSQWYMHEHGVDIEHQIDARYVGSQESTIMNVVLGKTDAGSTWTQPWLAFQKDHPELAAKLELAWETQPLVNNPLVARDDVPAPVVDAVRREITTLQATAEGRAILAPMELSQFDVATDATYAPVVTFVTRFEREVHPIEVTR